MTNNFVTDFNESKENCLIFSEKSISRFEGPQNTSVLDFGV